MTPHRRRPAVRRAARLVPPVAAAALLLPLAACGNAGELRGAGATPTAVGPVRLWPELPPVTAPPLDYGESDTRRVPGVRVPEGGVRDVDPVAVVRAELAADAEGQGGADGVDERTARAVRRCGTEREACPVLRPYYRDLTGDGREELILAVRVADQQVAVRCYLAEDGGLTRVMSTVEQLVSVELAGRDLILRAVSAGIPGYEYRTAWSWDARQGTMLPARDEIVRVKPTPPPPAPLPPAPLQSPGAPSTGDPSTGDPSVDQPSVDQPSAGGPGAEPEAAARTAPAPEERKRQPEARTAYGTEPEARTATRMATHTAAGAAAGPR
ncbi:hypothetical protein [Streptomyces fradiae]|uniref:hypothetical protein n=1 Tax=Streptomyces fradiae TaxID=1906 RepID=UPI003985CA35